MDKYQAIYQTYQLEKEGKQPKKYKIDDHSLLEEDPTLRLPSEMSDKWPPPNNQVLRKKSLQPPNLDEISFDYAQHQ